MKKIVEGVYLIIINFLQIVLIRILSLLILVLFEPSHASSANVLSKKERELIKRCDDISEKLNKIDSDIQNLKLQEADLFTCGNPEITTKLNRSAKIVFYLKDGLKFRNYNHFYLDVNPDLSRLINNNHLDYEGNNVLEEFTKLITGNPDLIKKVTISGLNQDEINAVNSNNLANRSSNPVVKHLLQWADKAFDEERPKPVPFNSNVIIDVKQQEAKTQQKQRQNRPSSSTRGARVEQKEGDCIIL